MTRVPLAAALASALVLTGVITHGFLTVATDPTVYSVVETDSRTPGTSAVTLTGTLPEAGGTDLEPLQATVHFRTDPAQRPDPQIVVVSTADADATLLAQALSNGDIVAAVTPWPNREQSRNARNELETLLRDAQHSDNGPFGQIFTNPTPPPLSRITG